MERKKPLGRYQRLHKSSSTWDPLTLSFCWKNKKLADYKSKLVLFTYHLSFVGFFFWVDKDSFVGYQIKLIYL